MVAMSASVQRIVLVACGCFNPITNMHLRLFELARDALHKTGRYRVLAGVLSPASDHYQKIGLLNVDHRQAMIRLATQSSDWIRMDSWEAQQPAWTRTALVIRHMNDVVQSAKQLAESEEGATARKRAKKDPDSLEEWLFHIIQTDAALAEASDEENNETKPSLGAIGLKLVCGSDLLQSFSVPNLWLETDIEILVRDHGIVCINRPGSDARRFVYETDLLSRYEDNIHIVTEWMVSDVSATKVRRAIRRGESVKYLLSDEVIGYIRKHSLYSGPSVATTPCPEKKRVRKQLSFDLPLLVDELHDTGTETYALQPAWGMAGSSGYFSVREPVMAYPTAADRVSRSVQTLMVSPEEQVVRLLKKCSRCGSRRLRFMMFDQSTPLHQSTGLEVVLKDLSLAHGETVL